uniref:IRG-type G domain-containing protein n=1 Tax=Acrobeloides nanus TaxID=290746 RepID=A0A914C2F2_9BILA
MNPSGSERYYIDDNRGDGFVVVEDRNPRAHINHVPEDSGCWKFIRMMFGSSYNRSLEASNDADTYTKVRNEDRLRQQAEKAKRDEEERRRKAEAEKVHQEELKRLENEKEKERLKLKQAAELERQRRFESQQEMARREREIEEQRRRSVQQIQEQHAHALTEMTKPSETVKEDDVEYFRKLQDEKKAMQEEERRRQIERNNALQQERENAKRKSQGDYEQINAITQSLQKPQFFEHHQHITPPAMPSHAIPTKFIEVSKNFKVPPKDSKISVGVIGLAKSGRSFLIGAIAGGLWPEQMGTKNPIELAENCLIYKLSYPNGGFVNGSVNENRPIFEEFFRDSNLKNLSLLLITVESTFREEDYLTLELARHFNISTLILRTKLDTWLDNLPNIKNFTLENKQQYVQEGIVASTVVPLVMSFMDEAKAPQTENIEKMLSRVLGKYDMDQNQVRNYMIEACYDGNTQNAHEERITRYEARIEAERVEAEQLRDYQLRQHERALKELEKMIMEQSRRYDSMEKYLLAKPKNRVRVPRETSLESSDAAKMHGVDNVNFINFAFVGHVKSGKSSLINAIRGFTSDDPEAAKTDIIECTQKIECYSYRHGEFPHVRFYDVPGAGTMRHLSENYYRQKALCAFDCLIVMVQQALGVEEIRFVRAAVENNQKVVFVRSKCDLDFCMKNESGKMLRTTPSSKEIKDHINELRKSFQDQIMEHAHDLYGVKIFFVSANSLRALVRAELSEMVFEEVEFLEYIYEQSKKARGVD